MSGKINVAVLGAGGMGATVIRHLKKSELVDKIMAQDIRPERVEQLKTEFGIHATTNLEEILSDGSVKAVFVTSSNAGHHPLVMQSLAAGKAVMCEKPIANTLKDAEEMVAKAEELGAFLQIGFECRYSKLYTQVKDWIDAGLLGEVNNTHCIYICSEFHKKGSWRNKLETGGGMFGEKLSHYVDLPRWWIGGQVKEVYSVCAPNVIPYYEVRDNYHTSYKFDNGAVSHLTFHMAMGQTWGKDALADVVDEQKEDGHQLRYIVVGTKGAASTDVFYRTVKRWEFGDSPVSMTSKLVETLHWSREEDHIHFHNTTDQTLDIVRRVVEGKPPMTPARDALETMRLVFAAEKSADTGKIINPAEVTD
jgi:predicted dehydrogenase